MFAELTVPARRAFALVARLYARTTSSRLAGGSAILFANALISAGAGAVFWTGAAWLYGIAAVGFTTAMVSVATLVASFTNLGLSAVVMRFLPILGARSTRLRIIALLIPPALAVLACLLLGMFAGQHGSLWPALVVLAAATALTLIQDSIYVARNQPGLVLARGIAAAVIRLVLLLPATTWGTPGLVTTYTVGALVAVLAGASAFSRRGDPAGDGVDLPPRQLVAYSASSYAGALLSQVPPLIYPILIAVQVSHEGAGAFAFAWMVTALLMAMPQATASMLLAQLATRPERAEQEARATMRALVAACVALSALALLGIALLASLILPASAAAVKDLAPPLLASVPLYAVTRVHITVLLLQRRLQLLILLNGVIASAAVLLPIILLPRYGLNGVAVGWLVGQLLGALIGYRLRSSVASGNEEMQC